MSQDFQLSVLILFIIFLLSIFFFYEFEKRMAEICKALHMDKCDLKTIVNNKKNKKLWNNWKQTKENRADMTSEQESDKKLDLEIFGSIFNKVLTTKLVEKIFARIDEDRDGKITMRSFHRFMEQQLPYDAHSLVNQYLSIHIKWTITFFLQKGRVGEKKLNTTMKIKKNETDQLAAGEHHKRHSTAIKKIEFALADETFERLQVEEEKKKLQYQLAEETLEKINKMDESKKLQYELAEERLEKLQKEEQTKCLQYQLAEERLDKFDKEWENKRVQYELADEKFQRMQLATEKDKVRVYMQTQFNLQKELDKLRRELENEKLQVAEANRKLSMVVDSTPLSNASRDSQELDELKEQLKRVEYQLADEKMEKIELQRKNSQSERTLTHFFCKHKLEEDSKRLQYNLADEKMENLQLTFSFVIYVSFFFFDIIWRIYYILMFFCFHFYLECQSCDQFQQETERLLSKLTEEKVRTKEIERQNSSILDEKKKLEYQLADERMEKLVLVRQLSKTPKVVRFKCLFIYFCVRIISFEDALFCNHQSEEMEKLSEELEQERNKRKEVEQTAQQLQRRASQMGIDLVETSNAPFDFDFESSLDQQIQQLQQELAEEKKRRIQLEIQKNQLHDSLLEQTINAQQWEAKCLALQTKTVTNVNNEASSGSEFVDKQDFDRLQNLFSEERSEKIRIQRESQKLQEELHILREMEQTEGALTYAQLKREYSIAHRTQRNGKKTKALQDQVDSERERSSTLTKRLSVANQVNVNKLLQYANTAPAIGQVPNAPVFRNKLWQLTNGENESRTVQNANETEDVPPPPSYPPPDVVEDITSLAIDDDQVSMEELEDRIRALQTENKSLKNKLNHW
ncbi:hypothetical protein RFI_26915 [Reticulomyxa filosa]|uniref:EF-hand domain-containing protein n=1 Tax=Reticulomyxa filosa TaxID=46433 RepID=X6MAH4_RETFI|nr:hypothetical protein RFI_26915 [Reticulomyxa filosa]|eukprot:ETO10462.1 hypothetical protein RFI_26915 [Reticulomyxa filosa]